MKIIYHLVNGRVSYDFYKDNREWLNETNYETVKTAYTFMTFFCFALAVGTSWNASFSSAIIRLFIRAGFVYGLLTLVVYWGIVNHKEHTRAMYYLFETFTFMLVIVSGTYYSPHDRAVFFFMMLIVVPLLYVERPIISIGTSAIACVIFGFVTAVVKADDPSIMNVDLMNAVVGFALSAVFIYYIRNLHLASMQATLLLKVEVQIDGLTGLLNKISTQASCQRYLEYNHPITNCVVIMLDIDDFKHINDTYGHQCGDIVLVQIGVVLKQIFRTQDIVGRIGGDEFLILMRDIENVTVAEDKAKQINVQVKNIFKEYGDEQISCSIGIVQNRNQNTTFMEMYQKADQALYQAKKDGKRQYVIYQM
ncbi:MAG: GGDEF domain-containing protein [Lachnospira sp.]|nr:GGDEF domain-containing protein [Lachnospira sp.]